MPGDRDLLSREGTELRVDALRNQAKILRAAARLLAEDPAVSVQRIADEAAVARPTVYRRYPTREALVDAILREAAGEVVAAARDALEAGGQAVATLRALIARLAEIGARYPILVGLPGLEVQRGRSGSASGSPRAEAFAAIETLIKRGQAEGDIRAEVEPAVLRQAILGALALSVRSDAGRAAAVGEQVAALLLDGARPRA